MVIVEVVVVMKGVIVSVVIWMIWKVVNVVGERVVIVSVVMGMMMMMIMRIGSFWGVGWVVVLCIKQEEK